MDCLATSCWRCLLQHVAVCVLGACLSHALACRCAGRRQVQCLRYRTWLSAAADGLCHTKYTYTCSPAVEPRKHRKQHGCTLLLLLLWCSGRAALS
jgi:hypothetical protein